MSDWGDVNSAADDDWGASAKQPDSKPASGDNRPASNGFASGGFSSSGFESGGFGGGDTGFGRGDSNSRGLAGRGRGGYSRGGFGGNSGFGNSSRNEEHESGKSSGFGSGGFGAGADDSSFGAGAGSSFGAGASSGFGSGASSGFGSRDNGGFGSNSDSGFGRGGGGSRGACYNCGEEGHQSRDCPQPRKPRDMKCYNCNGEGHQSRDCPEPRRQREDNFRGGFGDSNDVQRKGRGFESSDSGFGAGGFANRDSGSGARAFGSDSRFGGGADGFDSDRRPRGFDSDDRGNRGGGGGSGFNSRGGGFGDDRGRSTACFNCKQEGHRSSECPEPKNQSCFNCGQTDHLSRDCPNPPRPRQERPNEELLKKPLSTYVPKDEDVEVLFKEHIEQGEMFTKLFEAEVTLTQGGLRGMSEKGKKISSFDELELPELLAQNVVNSGYKCPTPIQQYAMPAIFKERDIMACAQTGSGKTAAFLLPVMATLIKNNNLSNSAERTCCPRCLIIAPTRELAVQIYNEGRKFANGTVLRVGCIYGGAVVALQKQQCRGSTILVATLGRLKQFISEGYISLREIKYIILDEADRMLDLGFEDDINFIFAHPSLTAKEERQTLMFSATFPPEVQEIASKQLKPDFLMITCGKIGVANTCIKQEFVEITSLEQKKEKLLEMLEIDLKSYTANKNSDVFNKKTMVFVSRKVLADTLGVILCQAGVPATTIHGDRGQQLRAEAINDFKYGRKPVLIATAVGERGLDIKGVDHVINYDLPTNGQDYVHRIGRTGRVGNPGRATSFYYAPDDRMLTSSLIEILTEAQQDVPEFLSMDAPTNTSRFAGFGDGGSTANQGAQEAEDDDDW